MAPRISDVVIAPRTSSALLVLLIIQLLFVRTERPRVLLIIQLLLKALTTPLVLRAPDHPAAVCTRPIAPTQLLAASGRRDEALYQALGARLRTRRVRAVLCVGLVRTN